jgi:hypothetical protein
MTVFFLIPYLRVGGRPFVLLDLPRREFTLVGRMFPPTDTLSDEIEPYLLREQFIVRTPRGRLAMPRAYQLLGKPMKRPPQLDQPGLFDTTEE